MKRILFLFTASLFLLPCSNDDNNRQPAEQNTLLKIKKYTSISFDENGDLEYNNSNYPMNSQTELNGTLLSQENYEYY